MQTVLVISGTTGEFRRWAQKELGAKSFESASGDFEKGGVRYVHIKAPLEMVGFRSVKVLFIGTWESHPEVEELKRQAMYAEMTR